MAQMCIMSSDRHGSLGTALANYRSPTARRQLQRRLDFDLTAIRPRYDHSTTTLRPSAYMIVECCIAALINY